MGSNFYGGRPGASFVITATYATIEELDTDLKKVPCPIGYEEYVLISTEDKNSEDNGKIFQRQMSGEKKLIGQIVGPAGPAPRLEMGNYDEIIEKPKPNRQNGELTPSVGKDSKGKIKWATFRVQDINHKETNVTIGFEIPYTNFQIALNTDAYATPSVDVEGALIDNNPFYQRFNLTIPKGKKGDALKNFRVTTSNKEPGKIMIYPAEGGEATVYPTKDDREILVYDQYDYDKNGDGIKTSIYVGDYNMIKNVGLADDGTLTISFTHEDNTIFSKKVKWITNTTLSPQGILTTHFNNGTSTTSGTPIKWIDKISLNTNNGHINITYNTKESVDLGCLKYVSDMAVSDTGDLTISYIEGNPKIEKNKVKWVKDVTLTQEGRFIMTFNTLGPDGQPVTYNTNLKWIDKASLDKNGNFVLTYNDNSPALTSTLKWVNSISISDTGVIKVHYNNGDSNTLPVAMKTIKSISLDDNGQFKALYNTSTTPENIGNPIKWVTDCSFTDAGVFKIDFNDKTSVTKTITWVKSASMSPTGLLNIKFNNATVNEINSQLKWIKNLKVDFADYHLKVQYINDATDKWHDLGSVKDNSGILIGENYVPTATLIPDIIAELNKNKPNGLDNHKIITTGKDEEEKLFFAFDENLKTWYYLGTLGDAVEKLPGAIGGQANDVELQNQWIKMPKNSVWLLVE